MKTILLKFSGPLQSWGTDSNFEVRHSDLYPSKSALVGLLAASLGYRRGDDDKISDLAALDYAVRIDQKGNLLRDYHVATKYKPNGTFDRNYVTNRYYLEDFVFVVALGHANDDFVEELAKAVQKPYFQTFMGRRALPLTYDFYLGIVEQGVTEALEKTDWQASTWYQKKHKGKIELDVYLDADLLENDFIQYRKDNVISFDQKARTFAYRNETAYKLVIDKLEHDNDKQAKSEEEHDAFAALEN